MLTQEDDVDAHALRTGRGWTISAIARHLGHDRKTIRAYLNGERVAGVRAGRGGPVRAVRRLLPARLARTRICGRRRCSTRSPARVRSVVSRRSPARSGCVDCVRIARRAGRRRPGRSRSSSTRPARRPSGTGWISRTRHPRGGGARPRRCSSARSRTRASGAAGSRNRRISRTPSTRSTRSPALGGVTRVWRFDRMATVCHPGDRSDDRVVRCGREALRRAGRDLPAAAREPQGCRREGQRQRRPALVAHPPDDITIEAAQASLDAFCARVGDTRDRVIDGQRDSVLRTLHGNR
jgi:hypothetical protein